MQKQNLSFSPVVIINNTGLFNQYQQAGIVILGLEANPSDKHLLEKGCREIGLIGPQDLGELVTEGAQVLRG